MEVWGVVGTILTLLPRRHRKDRYADDQTVHVLMAFFVPIVAVDADFPMLAAFLRRRLASPSILFESRSHLDVLP
jgi:hypothetical protein